MPCGDAGLLCGTDDVCYHGSNCLPLVDCNKGGGYLFAQGDCMTDGGTLGACCGTACIDLGSEANCGACGLACPAGTTCGVPQGYGGCLPRDGVCTSDGGCPKGEVCIDGIGCSSPTCNGTSSYCGLDGGGGACCGTTCAPVGIDCGGSCPSGTVRSTTNYGCVGPEGALACAEGAVCPAGTICSYVEEDCSPLDTCTRFSPAWGIDCPFGVDGYFQGICCDEACTDTSQDPSNCSGCGVVCPSGLCVPLASLGYGIGECLPIGPSDDCTASCPQGSVCLAGQCIDGSCKTSTFCPTQDGGIGMCCGKGSCVQPLDDPKNCGVCGNACGPDGTCVNGSCTSFPGCGLGRMNAYCNVDAGPDFLCCPSAGCTDVGTDSTNCGSCGNRCKLRQTCVGGGCQG